MAGGVQGPEAEANDLRVIVGPDLHALADDGRTRIDNDVENYRRVQVVADRPAGDRLLRRRGTVGGQRLRRPAGRRV